MFGIKSKDASHLPIAGCTIIGAGVIISGNIESEGDIRIDGVLKGNLSSRAKILLGPEAVVEGDIMAQQADILGRVLGKVSVNDILYLHGKAVIEGNIHTSKLQIDATASFNGACHMGANVVAFGNEQLAKAVNE
ncbi:MAG: polymer-forming cytoskeletal protein [Chitinophagaceae bacterium]|nr:polymer-forming cytoskeletal protein [Bacteroidota bacterium]MCC6257447.1 polymer-forming cytoskeletal protein [Chitinophagaceae bacterium]MCW5916520.1 polymer-forming cytoskeletal protein [Ferruginibacter sp.]